MKKTQLKLQGFSVVQLMLGVVIITIVGGTGFYVWRQNAGLKPPTIEQPNNPRPPGSTVTKPPATFDIEGFYNKLQTGMTSEEVTKLAGKQSDDCSITDSEPPSQSCFWSLGDKNVGVSYGTTNVVQAKNKTGF